MIELRRVSRVFAVGDQRVHALRDVDLRIGPGEYLSVMGPSGSGKSTLLHVIGLLDRPTAGTYLLDGRDTTAMTEVELARARRQRIGFVFQFFHLVLRLTALDNVALPLLLEGVAAGERAARAGKALAAMGLTPRAHHRPDQLSGGQRQRVAIARATILRPAVILADEPSGNLDRRSSHEIIDVLEALRQEGIALVVVTHDPEIGARARRRIKMDDGAIVADEVS
jgi:putative ABC transport system ATP-binding protein